MHKKLMDVPSGYQAKHVPFVMNKFSLILNLLFWVRDQTAGIAEGVVVGNRRFSCLRVLARM